LIFLNAAVAHYLYRSTLAHMSSGAIRCAVAAGVGLALTAAVALLPRLSFSYDAPLLRTVLETTVTLVGALIAFLCVGRSRRSHSPSDVITA
jgi:hypothetical protein